MWINVDLIGVYTLDMTFQPYLRWTEQESQILRDHYYEQGAAKLSRSLLSHRDAMQISSRAAYMGLSFNSALIGRHAWNTEDMSHIIGVYEPFHAYMLGFLWADGTVNKHTFNVKLKIVNRDWADIADLWLATAKSWRVHVGHDGNPNHQEQATIEINSQALHAFLVQYGYLFKSGGSAIEILDMIPDRFKHYWWRGYFDGDGGFTSWKTTQRISITSCYEQDWSFAEHLTREKQIGYRITRNRDKYRGYSHLIIDNEANLRRFMEYIYQGESFGLTRKRTAYDAYLLYKATIRPDKTSKYRGVCKERRSDKWLMQIYRGRHYRSRYKTELEAAHAYDVKAVELFGNKAVLNFPIS